MLIKRRASKMEKLFKLGCKTPQTVCKEKGLNLPFSFYREWYTLVEINEEVNMSILEVKIWTTVLGDRPILNVIPLRL